MPGRLPSSADCAVRKAPFRLLKLFLLDPFRMQMSQEAIRDDSTVTVPYNSLYHTIRIVSFVLFYSDSK